MLTPPDGLSQDMLAAALSRHWRLAASSMTYRPVGFGSHHWEVADSAGTRWFVTADELHNKRDSLSESLDSAFWRLRAALAAAVDLRASGLSFVVAPVPAGDGEPLVRAGDEFGVAVYPFVTGQSFGWGEFSGPAHLDAVLDLLIAVHTAPRAARLRAMTDDYAIAHRDELEAGVDSAAPHARVRAGSLRGRRRIAARREPGPHPPAARPLRRPGRAGPRSARTGGAHPRRATSRQHHADA